MENLERNNKVGKTFSDFIIILLKWRKTIIYNVLIVTAFATAISFMVDKWYKSTTSILPPKSKGGLLGDISNFSSTIKDISKTLGRLGSTSEEAYNYLALLQSRTCLERVINKFNLREVYNFKSSDPIEHVIKELESNINFNVADEGNITVTVTDKSPQRAAEMANYFVEVLNDISIGLGTFEARNNREFIEQRYFQVLRDLRKAEDTLKYFSGKYSVYSITDQMKAAITAAAELKAKIEVEDVAYELLKNNYGADYPAVIEKKLFIDEMQKKLKSMKYSDEAFSKGDVQLFTPFKDIPEIGTEYLRFKRELELQTKLLEFILPVYEQAKIEEKKNIPICLILDKAVPAEEKAGPKKAIIVGAAFLISLFLSIILSLILESLANLHDDAVRYKRLNEGIFIPIKKMFFIKRK
jgi:tyrosine-protein kinase Etk/Wzc